MAEGEVGPEPGGWELMRAIRDLRTTVENSSAKTVSNEVFLLRMGTADAHIAELKAQGVIDRTALETYKTKQDEQSGRNRLFVIGIIAAPVVTLLVNFLLAGGASGL